MRRDPPGHAGATAGATPTIRTLAIGFGARARAEAETILAEPGGFSEMLRVFFADAEQHFDHRSIQDHVAPNCTQRPALQGALRDLGAARSTAVGPRASRRPEDERDADEPQHRPVGAREGRRDPNLEIEANDVRRGDAASVGPVDEETIFYLQSRGITREDAERLIVSGFFQEVLDRVQIQEVREGAEAAIANELAEGARRMTLVKVCTRRGGAGRRGPPRPRGRGPAFAVTNLGEQGFRVVDAIC